jgi:hypothetical protein
VEDSRFDELTRQIGRAASRRLLKGNGSYGAREWRLPFPGFIFVECP